MKRRERRADALRTGKPFQRQQGSMRPFKRALETFQKIHAAMALPTFAEQQAALGKLPSYKSRGKGKARQPSPRYGRARSAYRPHQGQQECLRRAIGGWGFRQRLTGFTKRDLLELVDGMKPRQAADTIRALECAPQ